MFDTVSLRAALALLLALALLVQPGAAQPTRPAPLSETAFWQLVSDTASLAASGAPDAERQALLERWTTLEGVNLADGRTTLVDNTYVIALLTAAPPALEQLSVYTEGLLRARAEWPTRSPDPAQLTTLQTILARPEFQWQAAPPNPFQEWIDKILRFFLDLLDKIIGLGNRTGGLIPGWLSLMLLALLVGAILLFILRGIWKNSVRDVELESANTERHEILSADGALSRSRQLSGAGDYRQAVRYLYLSALLWLDENGFLRYDRTLTNREYLRQVARYPQLAAQLRTVIDTFDRVWYGFQVVDAASFDEYSHQIERLREERP